MAKAKAAKLVTRVVTSPKGIWVPGPGGEGRIHAGEGESVQISAKSAKAFARYLEAPTVAKAKKAAKVAEEAAAAGEEEEVEAEAKGGDSEGS